MFLNFSPFNFWDEICFSPFQNMDEKMKTVLFATAVVVLAGLIIFMTVMIFKKHKEGMKLFGAPNMEKINATPYYGLTGAPWGGSNMTSKEEKNQIYRWGWGGYQVPYKKSWWNSTYDWSFSKI